MDGGAQTSGVLGVRGARESFVASRARESLASLASVASVAPVSPSSVAPVESLVSAVPMAPWRWQEDLILDSAPRLYASGQWVGMFSWVQNLQHRCVVITCSDKELAWPDNATPFFLRSNEKGKVNGKTWRERHQEALSLVTAAIDDDASVLVHCSRGLHRTGAFITLWVALRMRAEGDTRPWLEVLSDAWEFFRTKRQLKERSRAPRNFEKESWQAVVDMYGYYFGAPGVRGVLGATSKARPRAKLRARQAIRVSEEHMEESAPSVVSAESMEPVASEERMEEGRRRDEGRMGGDERGKKEEMPPASLPPTAAAPPPQPPSGGLLLQVLGARTGNSLQAAPAREGKAPSAASAASARPRAKLLVRQAIRVKPVPKKIFLKRGKPKDRQC